MSDEFLPENEYTITRDELLDLYYNHEKLCYKGVQSHKDYANEINIIGETIRKIINRNLKECKHG